MYRQLPTSEEPLYPPPAHNDGPPYPLLPARPTKRWLLLKFVLTPFILLILLHYAFLGAFPSSTYTRYFRNSDETAYRLATASAHEILDHLDPSAGQPGTFFRDTRPIRSMLAFWDLAQKEVEQLGLDTCNDQLGKGLIDAYHRSHMSYCLPEAEQVDTTTDSISSDPHTKIWCTPVRWDSFSKWWPFPAAPCLSTGIRPVQDDERKFRASGCEITKDGVRLREEMGRERFLGSELAAVDSSPSQCSETVNRTLIVIGRQDQWNPFHVAEDLITTLVTVFIMARADPALIDSRVQLVFSEGYGMDANHFTPLWDRIGAWAPRRLGLDPWGKDVCLTNTIHSVGAGASLLSATGIGKTFSCASTITWAAAHYYRHLFGYLPPTSTAAAPERHPINILWLSRAKLDSYAQKHNDWSQWRGVRHITNEPDLIKRLKRGMKELCEEDSDIFGSSGCTFEDAQDVPETWALTSPDTFANDDPVPLRFATIDPTVHALETQIHYVGHTTILVSSHGGALGLSLFLPPGHGTIIELQVGEVHGNWHFQHMAAEMGHQYEMLDIKTEVDVDQVWDSVRRWISKQ